MICCLRIWALTRSKAKHRSRTHRRKRVANQPPNSPPVSNQTEHSLLSFTSQQKQSSEESLLPTYPPAGKGGRPIQTSIIIIFHSQPLTALLQFILHTIHPPGVGNCKYGAYLPTSSRLSRSSSVLLHKGPFPPPDFHFETTINTASRLLSQFTSQSAPTVLFLPVIFQRSAFSIQHSALSIQSASQSRLTGLRIT